MSHLFSFWNVEGEGARQQWYGESFGGPWSISVATSLFPIELNIIMLTNSKEPKDHSKRPKHAKPFLYHSNHKMK